MQKSNYFVDNKKLYDEFVKYRVKIDAWKEAGKVPSEKPPLPDYIARVVLIMVDKYAMKKLFINQANLDEMKGDAVETCVKYLHMFDPAKTNNPFAYITTTIHRAFVQRALREKRQAKIKKELTRKTMFEMMVDPNAILDGDSPIENLQKYYESIPD
jgi:hypothetical protein